MIGLHFVPQFECIPLITFYVSFGKINGSFKQISAVFIAIYVAQSIVLVTQMLMM